MRVKWLDFIIWICLCWLIGLLMIREARGVEIDLDAVATIESSNDPTAWNKRDDSRGLYQITEVCLRDYNEQTKSSYGMDDLWDVTVNEAIARWFITRRIPQLLKAHGLEVTDENVIACYNAGIGTLVKVAKGTKQLPRTTQDYLRKYARAEATRKGGGQ